MRTLALDVDGVLLDPDRGGAGHWTNELTTRFGIERAQLQEAFFMRSWDDVVNGRRAIEDALAEALTLIDPAVDVESVLSCWFDADYVPFEQTFELARRAGTAGCRVVLVTNQEHRRADFLRRRIGCTWPGRPVGEPFTRRPTNRGTRRSPSRWGWSSRRIGASGGPESAANGPYTLCLTQLVRTG